MSNTRSLVIVESPAKCKKIAGFLGAGFQVLATMGHIRCLEEDLDAVGLDRDFEPRFQFMKEKYKATKPIQEAAQEADIIYLAADDDREGEAIAYSVACLLKRDPLSFPRAVFHEITAKAVREAIQNPRKIDMHRVFAQQARSVLDMMVGFTISPVLWKHVARGLSAGRCQTPALRLVWDREQSIQKHSAQTSWTLSGQFTTPKGVQTKWSMDDELEDQESAMNYMENIHSSKQAKVTKVVQKPWLANPPKPLMTSTLQQEASALYNINPKSTMSYAQKLYEAGHITYMRTDHAVLSEEAIQAAQEYVRETYGEAYVGTANHCRAGAQTEKQKEKDKDKEKDKKSKTKNNKASSSNNGEIQASQAAPQAQEAHEAIRPTHMELQEIPLDWEPQARKIYSLIWRRAVQACMSPVTGQVRTATLNLEGDSDAFPWSAQWKMTEFQGWQILGTNAKLDDSEEEEDPNKMSWKQSQEIQENLPLIWSEITGLPKVTKASPRFTEATLIRELEHKGIGRPSTFASLVETLFDKKYIEKKDIPGSKGSQESLTIHPQQWPPITQTKTIVLGAEKQKLVPTPLGESVLTFALREFPQLFAYEFTAQMEARLDQVAKGEVPWKEVCRETWSSYKDDYTRLLDQASMPSNSEKVKDFGNGLKAVLSKNGLVLVQEQQGSSSSSSSNVKKKSKDEDKPTFYSFPEGYTMQTITEEVAQEHIRLLQQETHLGMWEGKPIVKKKGPYGEYAECGSYKINISTNDTLEHMYEKLREKAQAASKKVAVGGYRFAVGQYGPYMYKEGLKTKVFVPVSPDVDPRKLTLAEAEEMYKKGVEIKKAQAANRGSFHSGFRGGARGGRGGR